jgi:hypothetical protein
MNDVEMDVKGQVRVGRCLYDKSGKRTDPSYPGFEPIIVLTKSSQYGSLGPYELWDEKGVNMENKHQSFKLYLEVPATIQRYSRYDQKIIWEHPAEKHAERVTQSDGTQSLNILPAYLKWRQKLKENKYAVRYPVGFNHRHKCICALDEDENGKLIPEPLDYIEGRKRIYVQTYEKLACEKPQFKELQQKLARGINLLIIEVDLPHEESLGYYKERYGVSDSFIERGTMIATNENLDIMLNDAKHPYGHGYCLARMLINT